jgi:hypothetical protein
MNERDRKLVLSMVTAEFAALDPDDFEDAISVYGDDIETNYDLLEDHDCTDPGGHVFLMRCGNVKCVHCGRNG